MGFYFRKFLRKGPFAINFSKSGISYSIGIKGARVNFSKRGTYVTFGSNGIYYRKKISSHKQEDKNTYDYRDYNPVAYEQHTITSGEVEKITDVDSQDFIKELTEKSEKISYFKWFGVFPFITISIILFYTLFDTNSILFWICSTISTLFFPPLIYHLRKIDEKRLTIEIYYDIEGTVNEVYEKFVNNFSEFLNCSKVWQYLHSESTNNYKYFGGANNLVNRKRLNKISTNKAPLNMFKTNVKIPYLGLINTELYFFPERLIIKRGSKFGAIMYKNIECDDDITNFIEQEGVPSDSIVVGNTWRYLNKNGTPDKRFNNNYQIPICRYSDYSFKSHSGLNEKISTSKIGGVDSFIKYIRAIGQLQQHISSNHQDEEKINIFIDSEKNSNNTPPLPR